MSTLDWCGLLDVRYAPIAIKFCSATKSRYVPIFRRAPHYISIKESISGQSVGFGPVITLSLIVAKGAKYVITERPSAIFGERVR
jgi:hypothetical protein